jgi:hypothetical protein
MDTHTFRYGLKGTKAHELYLRTPGINPEQLRESEPESQHVMKQEAPKINRTGA